MPASVAVSLLASLHHSNSLLSPAPGRTKAMAIAELFLGAFLQVLFDRLASPVLLNFVRQRQNSYTLLKEWDGMLISINAVLADAEEKQINGNRAVNSWLENLRDLAYDIEDLLDVLTTDAFAERKLNAESTTSKVCSLVPACCFNLSPRSLMFDHKIRSEIEEIDSRLRKIIEQKSNLSLSDGAVDRPASNCAGNRPPSTYLMEPCFVGRQNEGVEILNLLTSEDDTAALKVIPIVGMGGVGKTTLAQRVFNDAKINSHFDVTAWTCVSDDFDVLAITKRILQSLADESCEGKDLNWLQAKLKEKLSERKFLVVWDDVWNEKYGVWTELLKPFQSGAKGSKIIVTARNHHVASIAGAPAYTLKELPQDACMALFAYHALGVDNFDKHPSLEAIGKKIVDKCKGLPLAAKTLGGLLRTKVNPIEWEAILNSNIWNLPEERNEILPALQLSYVHLPSHLKRCFSYCALFPKDYEFERDELIHWWMAEGLLQEIEGMDKWKVGLNYFDELVSRSFFEQSSVDKSRYSMHDLLNDLAKSIAGAVCFCSGTSKLKERSASPGRTRHSSFASNDCITSEKLKVYHKMKRLRSFILLGGIAKYGMISVSQKVLQDLLSELKYLRAFSLSCARIEEVPDCIGKLKHLRYLNFSYTSIESLPESISNLHNLESLMLPGCQYLIKLPKDMEKLVNLRYLDIRDTPRLIETPLHIGNLVNLQMLSKFVVGTHNGARLKELKHLKHLGGELFIRELQKVRDLEDARDANLCNKQGVDKLLMEWTEESDNSRNEEHEAAVLEFLQPHKDLQNLTISYYGGTRFPPWLGSPSVNNIMYLRLQGCRRIKLLPCLGQLPVLKELFIEGLNAVSKVGYEFYGSRKPFPSLRTLEFKEMSLWEEWSHCTGSDEVEVPFPCLQQLIIHGCPMLAGRLPSQLNSLIEFKIIACPRLHISPFAVSLPSLSELYLGDCTVEILKSFINMALVTKILMQNVTGLTCFDHGFISLSVNLENLIITNCDKLVCLCKDQDDIQNLSGLKRIAIGGCPEFTGFVADGAEIELPQNLETIEVWHCVSLEKLPINLHILGSLRDLSIRKCPKLVSFLETGLPASTISLSVESRESTVSSPTGLTLPWDNDDNNARRNNSGRDLKATMPQLQKLTIYECPLSPSEFSNGRLPPTLKELYVEGCVEVESLTDIIIDGQHCHPQLLEDLYVCSCKKLRSLPQCLHVLSHLTSLTIMDCPALEMECLPSFPLTLSRLWLRSCPKIKSLPDQLYNLTSLKSLTIESCEGITRLPQGGLPPNLNSLKIRDCVNMEQAVREWELHRLGSLSYLEIDGSIKGVGDKADFPSADEDVDDHDPWHLLFPPTLSALSIENMRNVERLLSGLRNHLPSLRSLWISDCPKLRYLPEDGFPPSLEHLSILNCEALVKRCSKPNGHYWHLLQDIPCLLIYGNSIQ